MKTKIMILVAAANALALNLQAAFVSQTGGVVAFDPSEAVEPVMDAAIAAVLAGVGLFVLGFGIRKVYGMIKGAK